MAKKFKAIKKICKLSFPGSLGCTGIRELGSSWLIIKKKKKTTHKKIKTIVKKNLKATYRCSISLKRKLHNVQGTQTPGSSIGPA